MVMSETAKKISALRKAYTSGKTKITITSKEKGKTTSKKSYSRDSSSGKATITEVDKVKNAVDIYAETGTADISNLNTNEQQQFKNEFINARNTELNKKNSNPTQTQEYKGYSYDDPRNVYSPYYSQNQKSYNQPQTKQYLNAKNEVVGIGDPITKQTYALNKPISREKLNALEYNRNKEIEDITLLKQLPKQEKPKETFFQKATKKYNEFENKASSYLKEKFPNAYINTAIKDLKNRKNNKSFLDAPIFQKNTKFKEFDNKFLKKTADYSYNFQLGGLETLQEKPIKTVGSATLGGLVATIPVNKASFIVQQGLKLTFGITALKYGGDIITEFRDARISEEFKGNKGEISKEFYNLGGKFTTEIAPAFVGYQSVKGLKGFPSIKKDLGKIYTIDERFNRVVQEKPYVIYEDTGGVQRDLFGKSVSDTKLNNALYDLNKNKIGFGIEKNPLKTTNNILSTNQQTLGKSKIIAVDNKGIATNVKVINNEPFVFNQNLNKYTEFVSGKYKLFTVYDNKNFDIAFKLNPKYSINTDLSKQTSLFKTNPTKFNRNTIKELYQTPTKTNNIIKNSEVKQFSKAITTQTTKQTATNLFSKSNYQTYVTQTSQDFSVINNVRQNNFKIIPYLDLNLKSDLKTEQIKKPSQDISFKSLIDQSLLYKQEKANILDNTTKTNQNTILIQKTKKAQKIKQVQEQSYKLSNIQISDQIIDNTTDNISIIPSKIINPIKPNKPSIPSIPNNFYNFDFSFKKTGFQKTSFKPIKSFSFSKEYQPTTYSLLTNLTAPKFTSSIKLGATTGLGVRPIIKKKKKNLRIYIKNGRITEY